MTEIPAGGDASSDPARDALEAAVGPLPRTTADIRALEEAAQVPTYSKFPIALVRGEGCYVFDADGKRYLDAYGGHAVALRPLPPGSSRDLGAGGASSSTATSSATRARPR